MEQGAGEIIFALWELYFFTFFASYFGIFESIFLLVEEYNRREIGGLFTLSVYLTFALGIFFLRRGWNLKMPWRFRNRQKRSSGKKEKDTGPGSRVKLEKTRFFHLNCL
ncbi:MULTISPECIES: hypothetical protein [unclassified Methanosarcina]|uniref:hypothetical protein n=1 Tax=unclassified Methanosarcina TaxID=2644672 RepID=UPI000615C5ED|nr:MULTISPECIES: hypothetical protein [unclassified Methanosarcina]AKB18599.1 hypothetical protein MSWHS_1736 [Methanosarcina sp. WWM596]AKB21844.1 hypothetical protein MSWH1_1573 [Methanosarcina sp. WH1]